MRRKLGDRSVAEAQSVDLAVGIGEHPLDTAFHRVLADQAGASGR